MIESLDRVGIRDLRNDVAALVRRAAAGERLVVTVDGRPTAQLGPLHPPPGELSLHDLAATGLLEPPQARKNPSPPEAQDLAVDVRIERVMDELRGH